MSVSNLVLVVGGGSGIGKKTVEVLSYLNIGVIVADQDVSSCEGSALSGITSIKVNVLEKASLDELVNRLLQMNSSLIGLVYTVGTAQTKPIMSMKAVEYEKLLELNAIAFLRLLSLLDCHKLFALEGASVVVVSSLVASCGARGKIGYAASKGALESAVKSLAIEYADRCIRVNAVAPGTVHTEMLDRLIKSIGKEAVNALENEYPLGLGDPEDVANTIAFLISRDSGWITGNVFMLDGAFSTR
jgi:NAD(P)-dependent dehydrogenase (short-subunit alcohol dehydrogenase family)